MIGWQKYIELNIFFYNLYFYVAYFFPHAETCQHLLHRKVSILEGVSKVTYTNSMNQPEKLYIEQLSDPTFI